MAWNPKRKIEIDVSNIDKDAWDWRALGHFQEALLGIKFEFCPNLGIECEFHGQKQWPPKVHIKFRNTDPHPPYLGVIPRNSFLTASLN